MARRAEVPRGFRIRISNKGLEWSEDQDHDQDQDQDQGAFCSGKAIIDWWIGSHIGKKKKKKNCYGNLGF